MCRGHSHRDKHEHVQQGATQDPLQDVPAEQDVQQRTTMCAVNAVFNNCRPRYPNVGMILQERGPQNVLWQL